MIDIYFETSYGKLYEKHENGTCEVFKFETPFGSIQNMYIKREIPIEINSKSYYDIITPYGYGGPLILNCKEGYRERLVEEFKNEFQTYCEVNNIVSEFVRFHPVIGNVADFKGCYDTVHIRNTVGTNLTNYENPFQSEFSKSCRKNIRRALKNHINFRITESPKEVSVFKKFYYSTMDRNKASDFYYFDDDYFNMCVDLFRDNLLLVEAIYKEQTIAMGFYFIYKDFIHIHLSGTLNEFLHLSPAYILRYAVTLWGKEKGYKLIHHGGGRTNDPEDSLYKFKKQFGKNTEFEFCTGKKVWNPEVYQQLCNKKGINDKVDFFPAYRYQ